MIIMSHSVNNTRRGLVCLFVQIQILWSVESWWLLAFFQNSQQFNEDLLWVNASAFSFVLCIKAIDYASASNYVISTNWTAIENLWWNFSLITMFSREKITDIHWYLDCLNFYYCPVGISNKTHSSTSKVFRSNCLFVNFKPQTKEFCYYKPKTKHTVSLMITARWSVYHLNFILFFGKIL